MDLHFATNGIPPLKLLCTQILLTEGNAAENFKFIKRSLLEETGLIFMVLTQMRQELQVKHQKPNEKSLLGSLLTKLYLNLRQCLLQW